MKNSIITLCLVMGTSLLMAGGNVSSNLSTVAEVPAKACKENKIYVDKRTDLMWQDQAYTVAENGAFKREKSLGKAGSHRHAMRYCKRLNYAGYTDWRLPSSDELSAVHFDANSVFTYTRDNDFWSSNPTTENRYYVVFPADSRRYARSTKQSNFIRCVRCIKKEQ